jgi:nucleotide-binding universal stress UspA family protein
MGIAAEKILLATDGSKEAARASRAAIDLSDKTGAQLHVMHSWQQGPPPTTYPTLTLDRRYSHVYANEARELLEAETHKIRQTGATVVQAHLREGPVAEEIVALADALDADLVVVGSRGAGPVKRLVTGSVSEGVVRLSSRPTLVIGDDSSETSKRACNFAAGLGELFEASVLLVQVYHHQLLTRSAISRAPRRSEQILEASRESLQRRADELAGLLGRRPEVRVAVGDAASVIQRVADEGGAGTLVALGSRGLGVVSRLTLGSISTDVLRAVEGPVLVVPDPEES